MRVPSDEVRLQVCETIIKFYDEAPPVQLVQRKFYTIFMLTLLIRDQCIKLTFFF